jgi:hypothetical protein
MKVNGGKSYGLAAKTKYKKQLQDFCKKNKIAYGTWDFSIPGRYDMLFETDADRMKVHRHLEEIKERDNNLST